jgi:small-conductance mechanosensitive channel
VSGRGQRSRRELRLARQLSRRAVRRARIQSLVVLPLLAGVLTLYAYRGQLFGRDWDTAVRGFTAVALLSLGWELARNAGRALAPPLYRRLQPGTAGTVDFVIRLLTMLLAIVLALRVAGISPRTLAVGGAVTAVVVGLAAQQTLGHLIAGTVLMSARPFRVGERVRLQGGGLAGTVEGVVSSLGLLYTTLSGDDGPIMVPNALVLGAAAVPLREPAAVELRARLRPGITPADVEELVKSSVETPLRGPPRVTLEELDGDEVVVRIAATPHEPADGRRLAGELLAAIAPHTVHGALDHVESRTTTPGG